MPECYNPGTLGQQGCDQSGPPLPTIPVGGQRPPPDLFPVMTGPAGSGSFILPQFPGPPGSTIAPGVPGGRARPAPIGGVPRPRAPPPIAAPAPPAAPVSVAEFAAEPISGIQFLPAAVGFAVPLSAADQLLQETLAAMTDAEGNPIFEGSLKPLFPPEPAPPFVGPPPPPPPVLETPPVISDMPTIAPATEVSPGQLSLFEEPAAAEAGATLVRGLLGRILGFLGGPAALALQPSEAGLPAAVESALVESTLEQQGFGTFPITLPSVERLPVAPSVPIGGFEPAGTLPEIAVQATGVPAALVADQTFGLGTFNVGVGEIPGVSSGAKTRPSTATQPQTRPGLGSQRQPGPLLGEQLAPGTIGGKAPGQIVDPLFVPTTGPSTQPSPKPSLASGGCQCVQTKEKKPKKQKQKKKQRDICYRGTYIEHSSGLIKHRKERIECR